MTMHLFFVFFFLLQTISASVCNPKNIPNRRDLRADQLTILISGFSESRLPLLRSLSASYASSPSVAAVLILWCNPETPSRTLSQFFSPPVASTSPISIHRSSSTSLNARFLPRRSIPTRAVAVCDDDVEIDPASLEFSFKIWQSNPDRLVGFFARSHDYDLEQRSWIYTVRPDCFSIVLTKFMILDMKYLWQYSCSGNEHTAATNPGGCWRTLEDGDEPWRTLADAGERRRTLAEGRRKRESEEREGGERRELEEGLARRTRSLARDFPRSVAHPPRAHLPHMPPALNMSGVSP